MELQAKIKVLQTLGRLILVPGSEHALGEPGVSARDSHRFSAHTPLWAYCDPMRRYPLDPERGSGPELFCELPPDTGVAEAAAATRILVFLGAAPSPEMEASLADGRLITLVLEPDPDRFAAFLSSVDARGLATANIFFVVGQADLHSPPLSAQLPPNIWNLGFPAFFVAQGRAFAQDFLRESFAAIEILYYRHRIYPAESQESFNAQPMRPIRREMSYDHTRHAYLNSPRLLRSGSLDDIAGRFAGKTALLCAAGPALDRQLSRIAELRKGAVLIAVNSSARHLLRAGIEPDFVVINDTSVASAATLEGLPPLPRTALVSHTLSGGPSEGFGRRYYFGNYTGQLFPELATLSLHGSVLTTAFSLAECLGCSRAVLAGAQLSFPLPYEMSYAGQHGADSLHRHLVAKVRGYLLPGSPPHTVREYLRSLPQDVLERFLQAQPIGRWPQFVPHTAADGSQVYTTLNFLDVAHWFLDRIRGSGLEVVNTVPESILHGRGIRLDTALTLPEDPEISARMAGLGMTPPPVDPERLKAFLLGEMARWRATRASCEELLANRDQARILRQGEELIRKCDADNTSYLLQRFGLHRKTVAMSEAEACAGVPAILDISLLHGPGRYHTMRLIPGRGSYSYGDLVGHLIHGTFHQIYSSPDPVLHDSGVVYYHFWLREMCAEFIQVIKDSLLELRAVPRGRRA